MKEGTVRAWGGTFINRGISQSANSIKLDGVEVYKAGHLSDGGDLDSLIVRNCFFAGSFKIAGAWGATFDFQGDKINYVEFTNNTFMFCIFGPFITNSSWGAYFPRTIGKVIIDHNTIYNIDGAQGPAIMISRASNVIITNNLFINPGFRPKEDYFSDKYRDFPQNGDSLGANASIISVLGPKGTWIISLDVCDSAKTDLIMEANNINFTSEVMAAWTSRGQTKPWNYTNNTKLRIKDTTNASFSEELQFVHAPATPMYAINIIADTCKKFNADPVKYSGKTPYQGFLYYDASNKPLYDFKVKDSINMSYPNTAKSYKASIYTTEMKAMGLKGAKGLPIGDLNWFPWINCFDCPVNTVSVSIPAEYELSQNYPNPFNPTTNINFSIQQSGFVTLKVFNILGQEVATLVSQNMQPGKYSVDFDASSLPSGVYVYQINAGTLTSSKKMMLAK